MLTHGSKSPANLSRYNSSEFTPLVLALTCCASILSSLFFFFLAEKLRNQASNTEKISAKTWFSSHKLVFQQEIGFPAINRLSSHLLVFGAF